MTNLKENKHSKGFSLVEAMIVVALIGIVFTMGPRLFVQINRFFTLNQTKLELQRDSRNILSIISRKLRQASAGSIEIDSSGGMPYSRLSYEVPSEFRRFVYYQQGKNLVMEIYDTASATLINTKQLTDDVRYLCFAPPRSEDLSIISISLTLEKGVTEGRTKALHMASERVMVMNY